MAVPVTATIFVFIFLIGVFGIPLDMNIQGISRGQHLSSFMSTHESVVKLISVSQLSLSCPDTTQCVRPVDFSHVKTNVPIAFESCRPGEAILRCDDVRLNLKFTSRDLLKIGLRL